MPNPSQLSILHTRIAPASVASESSTGIPAEVTAAQCILESGWLDHAPQNNAFGIKEYHGCCGRQLLTTKEWFNNAELSRFLARADGRTAEPDAGMLGKMGSRHQYIVQDWFATFATLADCFTYHARLLLNGAPYKDAAQQYQQDHDLIKFVRSIAPHYATDPTYAHQVESLATSTYVKQAIEAVRYALAGY